MRHFLMFLAGLAAVFILIANLGPMVLLGVSIWLLYLIFKQFVKATTTIAKVGWVTVGLIVLSIGISNIYAVIGIAAAFILYWIYHNWNKNNWEPADDNLNDPFMNFEREWQQFSK